MNTPRRTFLLGSLAAAGLSRPSRAEDTVRRDIVYGEPGGHRLLLDLYLPGQPGPHPVVVLVHGGGWLQGSKEGYRQIGPMLAAHGYAGCAINYRLAPEFPYPAAMDDCQRAVRWVRAHGAEYGIDGKRVAAMGDSAGGHLVALIGVRDTRDNSDKALSRFRSRPDCVVANYGAHELVRMWKIEQAHKPLTAWLGGAPEGHQQVYAEASPVAMADRKAPPFLIVHGDKDAVNPYEQSVLLHEALQRKKRDTTLITVREGGHGWSIQSPQGKQAWEATFAFLDKHLKRGG
jgi:acetyl esterase/lipase